jgi:hypothetical protein
MKVKELIKRLADFNPEAEVDVIANNHPHEFSICWGGHLDSEGTTKLNTTGVSIYVDDLNQSESAG